MYLSTGGMRCGVKVRRCRRQVAWQRPRRSGFASFGLFEAFESNHKPVTGFLLGDSGYMLRDWLLTPLTNPRTQREMAYNFHQSSARTTVERSIGVAKRRWHCLRRLRVAPVKACEIITVCLMLHNRARLYALPDAESDDEDDDVDDSNDGDDSEANDDAAAVPTQVGGGLQNERTRTAAGKVVRNQVMNMYF